MQLPISFATGSTRTLIRACREARVHLAGLDRTGEEDTGWVANTLIARWLPFLMDSGERLIDDIDGEARTPKRSEDIA